MPCARKNFCSETKHPEHYPLPELPFPPEGGAARTKDRDREERTRRKAKVSDTQQAHAHARTHTHTHLVGSPWHAVSLAIQKIPPSARVFLRCCQPRLRCGKTENAARQGAFNHDKDAQKTLLNVRKQRSTGTQMHSPLLGGCARA